MVPVKRLIGAVLAVFVLGVTCVLPFVADDDTYGEVEIPGSGTVHLPAGDVDVTLSWRRLEQDADAVPVPPPSLHISAPDGRPQPEVVESRRSRMPST
jgi:hypothetical protein